MRALRKPVSWVPPSPVGIVAELYSPPNATGRPTVIVFGGSVEVVAVEPPRQGGSTVRGRERHLEHVERQAIRIRHRPRGRPDVALEVGARPRARRRNVLRFNCASIAITRSTAFAGSGSSIKTATCQH